MRNKILILLMSLAAVSCHYTQQSEEYDVGYNFRVVTDTMTIQEERPMHNLISPELGDSFRIYHNDLLVVEQIEIIPEDSIDSIWVKVARDQMTQGWIHETELLQKVVPDDPISEAIYTFSSTHLLAFIALFFVALVAWLTRRMFKKRFHMVHVDDIPSPYPMLLCLTLSSSAVLYATIQMFVPETWVYFYFHPTLNPFGLPMVLSAFLTSVWLMIILLGAALDDINRCLRPTEAILYTLSLIAALGLLYVIFSVSTLYYVGYPLLVAYSVAAIIQYWRKHRARYICGQCGAKMHDLGECQKCGTKNK